MGTAAERVRWDAPAATVAYHHDQLVAALCLEALDQPVPALVTTPRAHRDVPAAVAKRDAALHLNAKQPAVELGDEVPIRTVADRETDGRSLRREPFRRGQLAEVSLSAPVHSEKMPHGDADSAPGK
jgi:hypothetical protein